MNTHGEKVEVRCVREPMFRSVRFWIYETHWTPDIIKRSYALPLTFTVMKQEDEGSIREPTFSLRDEQAQQFMDELWRVGFRPSEGSGSSGSLAATERHLEDMRTIVFKTLRPAT